MKRLRSKTKYFALIFLMLVLHTITLSFVALENEELPQKQACSTASLTADDSLEQTLKHFFKPPKNSFIDYSTFFDPNCLIPTYAPDICELVAREPLKLRLEVYREIDVPPDCLA